MGLLRAGVGALSGALADSWREYFYCEAIDKDILATKGVKRTGGRSSNTRGTDNIISNGSIIAVADGQCMIIVEQGKVVELCNEPGEFVYDSSTEPTIMYGGFNGENIKKCFAVVGKRFTFGGEPPKDQRIYYFNTKEIMGNKYGTQNPIPFRVVDKNIGLDMDIGIRCNGEYSYKIVNPMLFYTNVCGNVSESYSRTEIDSQLKVELLNALQPAFGRISELGVRYSALMNHTNEIADSLNEILSAKWSELRGIKVASFAVASMTANEDDVATLKEMQRAGALRDPRLGAGLMAGATASAMQDAAKNPNGAMMGFMGMGLAQNMGGNAAANLYQQGQQQYGNYQPQYGAAQGYGAPQNGAPQGGYGAPHGGAPQQTQAAPPQQGGWTCECGAVNTGRFCQSCGKPQPQTSPAPQGGWTCECGAVNAGKFCPNCGKSAPAAQRTFKCDKCGWIPEDPTNPPKFCPNCGDPFNENDAH